MTSCLLVAPINSVGMGTHGYFWTRELLPLLEQSSVQAYVLSNGEIQRNELNHQDLNPLDRALKAAIERPFPPNFLPDLSIGICAPLQFQDIPGKARIGYIVFEGDLLPKHELDYLQPLDALAVPSHWGKQVLERSFLKFGVEFKKPIYVWPEGVDTESFFPPTPYGVSGPLSHPSIDFTFSNVGKLEKRKGTEELISAFGKLVDTHPQKALRLLGHWQNPWRKDWMETAEEALVRAGFPTSKKEVLAGVPLIRFRHGKNEKSVVDIVSSALISKEDVLKIYRASDAGVYPYAAEGWCLPLIESMACGIPSIANPYSGPTEFLREGDFIPLEKTHKRAAHDGNFFKNGEYGSWREPDADDLLEKMDRLLSMSFESRKQMGIRASDFLKNEFSWARSAKRAFQDIQFN